ncbi:MAG TPA: 2-phospho-L-lactate transferase [Acidimicrobiales bacterium]|nr:2-phospho-L-lactate transferase [Acidimicrobiales bacterium]
MSDGPRQVTALAGGVGAAKMLRGLASVLGARALTAIVNTGDDVVLHGLHVSPDIDTVTYTLAGVNNDATGWGLAGETWAVMSALRAFGEPALTWFNLGDRDLATHLFRTGRLAEGARLSEVTDVVAQRFGVQARILPMSDERVETRVTVLLGPGHDPFGGPGEVEVGFQEYFVGLRHEVPVISVRFVGAATAPPGPGVLEALQEAERIVICPSNPVVSIGPVLALPALAGAVASRRESTVAVSPIIAGKALKGPADRMLAELGYEASVAGVAQMWAPFASTLVVDQADAHLAGAVEAQGMRCVVAPSVMSGPMEAASLARAVLSAPGLRGS